MNGYGMLREATLVKWLSHDTFKPGVRLVPEWVLAPEKTVQDGLRYVGTRMDGRHNVLDDYASPGKKSKMSVINSKAADCQLLMSNKQVRLGHVELDRVRYPTSNTGEGAAFEISAQSVNGQVRYRFRSGSVYDYSGYPVVEAFLRALDNYRPDWKAGRTRQWERLNECIDRLLESQESADKLVAELKTRGLLKPVEFVRSSRQLDAVSLYKAVAVRRRYFTLDEWESGVDPSGWGEDGLTMDELRARLLEVNPTGEKEKERKKAGVLIWKVALLGNSPDYIGWGYVKL